MGEQGAFRFLRTGARLAESECTQTTLRETFGLYPERISADIQFAPHNTEPAPHKRIIRAFRYIR